MHRMCCPQSRHLDVEDHVGLLEVLVAHNRIRRNIEGLRDNQTSQKRIEYNK